MNRHEQIKQLINQYTDNYTLEESGPKLVLRLPDGKGLAIYPSDTLADLSAWIPLWLELIDSREDDIA